MTDNEPADSDYDSGDNTGGPSREFASQVPAPDDGVLNCHDSEAPALDASHVSAASTAPEPFAVAATQADLVHRPTEPMAGRPRFWTPIAITAITLVMFIVASVVMVFVAMIAVNGSIELEKLIQPDYMATLMSSRLGFCCMVIPPQLTLIVPSIVAAVMSPVETRKRLSLVRGRWPIWAWFAAAAAAPLVGLISSLVLGMFVTESESLKMMSDVFREHGRSGFLIPLALMIGMTPAICEEILFRGYVQTRLAKSFSPLAGILVASILFAAFHVDFVHAIAVFPLGLFLGFVVWRSESLFPAMLAHFVNNVISVVASAYAPEDKTDVLGSPVLMVSLLILVTGIMGAAAVVVASVQYGRPDSQQTIIG